ncbi:dioxygenase family protein [Cytobacillus purgationiresistens]|uniref:Protocatechuate 3,4-dioxygenase beta subunit n=1 Tax=Cytobacillus purgationiresistens TaxID=863449 RepID=A0ABU0ANF4_9BACI|nr:hypothetical protein [Cytobacillus purgationiresistens]MDQ0272725.1 protocatechuate 3,4-dioxygenase beta subunit [Cytobacillus purgationiresistens]
MFNKQYNSWNPEYHPHAQTRQLPKYEQLNQSLNNQLILHHPQTQQIKGLYFTSNTHTFLTLSYSFEDTNQCILSSQAEEGPFYLENTPYCRDIRENQTGEDLLLRLKVVNVKGCTAISGAEVHLWHSNAFGDYSGYDNSVLENEDNPEHIKPTNNETFLRCRQTADAEGMVEFLTKFPGWYETRTIHILMKVFVKEKEVLTTQIFFPQGFNYMIQSKPPYYKRYFSPVINEDDFVLRDSHGVQGAWPKIRRKGQGYKGTLTIGVMLKDD